VHLAIVPTIENRTGSRFFDWAEEGARVVWEDINVY